MALSKLTTKMVVFSFFVATEQKGLKIKRDV